MAQSKQVSLAKFYAISPIHAGSGTSTAAVDLPIQRERHTNWPHIQASGVKGAFRSHYRTHADNNESNDLINYIFGSDEQDNWKRDRDSIAAAVSFSDGKLLFFPVRSNISPFLFVTCPAVLNRFSGDLVYTGIGSLNEIPNIEKDNAITVGGQWAPSGQTILEDAVVTPDGRWEDDFIQKHFPELKHALIISDEMFDYVVSSCTEVQTQIKIDHETGTAKDGALRYEELLPADTILYSIVHYNNQNGGGIEEEIKADMVRQHLETVAKDFIQIGGDATLGRGICKLAWIKGGQQ